MLSQDESDASWEWNNGDQCISSWKEPCVNVHTLKYKSLKGGAPLTFFLDELLPGLSEPESEVEDFTEGIQCYELLKVLHRMDRWPVQRSMGSVHCLASIYSTILTELDCLGWLQISSADILCTTGWRPPANFLFRSQDDWTLPQVLHKATKPTYKA